MPRIVCSTGALLGRPNGRDFHLLPDLVKLLHCDGLELMFYDTWYDKTKDLLSVVHTLSLPIPVFHAEKSICRGLATGNPDDLDHALYLFRINCQTAATVGCERVVFHLWDGWMNEAQILLALNAFPLFEAQCHDFGLELTVENIVCAEGDPLRYCNKLLQKHASALFTYDTKMAAFHGQEDELYSPENEEISHRIRHFHINDYQGGYKDWAHFKTLHIGEGQVQFDPLFQWLHRQSFSGCLTTEATSFDASGKIDIEKLNHTLDKLSHYAQQEMNSNGS